MAASTSSLSTRNQADGMMVENDALDDNNNSRKGEKKDNCDDDVEMETAIEKNDNIVEDGVDGTENDDERAVVATTAGSDSSSNAKNMQQKQSNEIKKHKSVAPRMESWFQSESTTLEFCDTMTAIQLEYRFTGDNMSGGGIGNISWWKTFQEVGFKYTTDGSYYAPMPQSLPSESIGGSGSGSGNDSTDAITMATTRKASSGTKTANTEWPFFRSRIFTAIELFAFLDKFAMPQLQSTLQDMPGEEGNEGDDILSNMSQQEILYWRNLRDELIYRQFYKSIFPSTIVDEDDSDNDDTGGGRGSKKRPSSRINSASKRRQGNHNVQSGRQEQQRRSSRASSATNRSTSVTASEPGAEIYLRKPKPKKNSNASRSQRNYDHDEQYMDDVVFPTIEEYVEQIKSAKHSNFSFDDVEDIEATLVDKYFDEWNFLLTTNHSLLLYGLGSKYALLNKFANEVLAKNSAVGGANGDLLVLDGFDKDISIHDILDLIIDYWLDGIIPPDYNEGNNSNCSTPSTLSAATNVGVSYALNHLVDRDVINKAICISRALSNKVQCQQSQSRRPLYLVIHTIDGIALRNHTSQQALAALVYHSYLGNGSSGSNGMNSIRLIASLDHVNAPAVLWNSVTRASFNWMWKQVHTYRPYVEETIESNYINIERTIAKKQQRSRRTTAASSSGGTTGETSSKRVGFTSDDDTIFYVLQSLSPRHTEALKQLAELQLKVIDSKKGTSAGLGNETATTSRIRSRRKDDDDDSIWVNYIDLMRQCQLKCVATDQALRNYLKELCDQEIVEKRQNASSSVQLHYRIPYSKDKLEDILGYQQQPLATTRSR